MTTHRLQSLDTSDQAPPAQGGYSLVRVEQLDPQAPNSSDHPTRYTGPDGLAYRSRWKLAPN